jgi:tetratricopeptide (TPR) repeat protein
MTRILVFAAGLAILVMPRVRAQGLDVTGLLETYYQGRYDEAVAKAAALPDLGPFRLRFVQDTPGWVNADPTRIDARSAAAAAFLLEVAAARVESDWGRFGDLIEYACVQLRTTGPPTPFEREWHAASHAIAGRARARLWLLGEYARLPHQKPTTAPPSDPQRPPARHLMHALERFPDDARFQLSRVVAWTWGRDAEPIRNLRRRDDGDRRPPRRAPQMEAITVLEPLTSAPDVAPEAWIRIGLVHFSVEDFASALRAFESAQIASEPAIKYLAHFDAARALERLARPDDAVREYQKALEVIPGAESATVALASLQFMRDDRDTAVSLIDRVFNRSTGTDDPGRLAGYGSFLRWPLLRAAMRKALPE